jgi:cytochrome c
MRKRIVTALGAAVLVAAASSAWADGDPAKGEVVFKKCAVCHMVGPDAKAKVGPPLNGVVGGPWGHVEGYAFSKPLLAGKAEGKMWDVATLDAYLEAPKKIIPGGKMAFAGLKKPEERADVIAYLSQFNAAGEKQ